MVYCLMFCYRYTKNLIFNEYYDWMKDLQDIKCIKESTPVLIMCSSEDRLIYDQDVERFAKYWNAIHSNLTTIKFHGSEHVEHFRVHPQVYLHEIRSRL
jgi:alpha-beta hydrolase superfamily lysophospholipase